ncbi:hypothetical protein [Frankia sp. R43]|uniref:hypothetical protein n=1 Tax=Frankia sp. R43 TaxID=269536 RepID=UPI000A7C78E8|nr:hypothetical protein [Frankia sp. R43]
MIAPAPAVPPPADPSDLLGRWGDLTFIQGRLDGGCRYCGKGGPDGDHLPTACRACGMRICRYPGECPICFVGLLDGVAYTLGSGPVCGYARCGKPPVAKAPRVRYVCADHLDRPTQLLVGRYTRQRVTLGELVRGRAERTRTIGRPEPSFAHSRWVWVPGATS